MTSTIQNGEGVEVIQSDRNFAADYSLALGKINDRDHAAICQGLWDGTHYVTEIARYRQSLAREPATADVEREELTPAQLGAIIGALTFCLADEWDENSHEHSPAVYERALAKVQSLEGRLLKGSLRVALDECNLAFRASDGIAKNAERRCTELAARVAELEAAPTSEPAIAEGERWRERWYGSEPQKGSAIVDERGNLIAYLGGDEETHRLTTAIVAAHNETISLSGESNFVTMPARATREMVDAADACADAYAVTLSSEDRLAQKSREDADYIDDLAKIMDEVSCPEWSAFARQTAQRIRSRQIAAPKPSNEGDETAALSLLRSREIQAIGAAISTRNWHDLETAYNQARDHLDRILTACLLRSRKP